MAAVPLFRYTNMAAVTSHEVGKNKVPYLINEVSKMLIVPLGN